MKEKDQVKTGDQENLQGIVDTLQREGVEAGNQAKEQIIAGANEEKKGIIEDAQSEAADIVKQAKIRAEQFEQNGNAALAQASRDAVAATQTSMLKLLQGVFGKHCETMFGEAKYFETLLGGILGQMNLEEGTTVQISPDLLDQVQQFLLASTFTEKVTLEPLPKAASRIVITCTEEEGLQYIVSVEDVQKMMFSIMNPDIVERIKKGGEE